MGIVRLLAVEAGQADPRTMLRCSVVLVAIVAAAIAFGGCSRGPNPPAPTEDLVPTVVGVIASNAPSAAPVALTNGTIFAPPAGAPVERIKNWPASDTYGAEGITPGLLLLGGSRPDGSWWYEIAGIGGGPDSEGCWSIYGGSWDEGDSVRFSSGLRLPKAPGFRIETHGHDSDNVQWFPGHQDDSICIDAQGRALYFDAFIGR